ncbi:MAG: DUF4143 domain-containing protein [bacterium]|nr:DUF4143 domain-containing protein [bacterium]
MDRSYFAVLVVEPLPAWSTHLRSKATMRIKPKRFYADPSMAAAALRATPAGLLDDPETFGLLFESMVVLGDGRRRAGLHVDGRAEDDRAAQPPAGGTRSSGLRPARSATAGGGPASPV